MAKGWEVVLFLTGTKWEGGFLYGTRSTDHIEQLPAPSLLPASNTNLAPGLWLGEQLLTQVISLTTAARAENSSNLKMTPSH